MFASKPFIQVCSLYSMSEKQSYWNKTGKYQDIADQLQTLVPDKGDAQDVRVDLFRRASNTYYEMYNNGGMNMIDYDWGEASVGEDGICYGYHAMKNLGIEFPTLDKHLKEYCKIDEDGDTIGDTDMYFEAACQELNDAMDQVIEHIMHSYDTLPSLLPPVK
tara:strand:+ start:1726 stop:2211 length:486 start_codon:yes stop_codon:yes gene_type:complete